MRKLIAVLVIIAMAVVATAGAANYMYEKASVKGVGYKNVEMIVSTQTGFNGQKLVEKESGSGNVITERTELEAERQLNRDGTPVGSIKIGDNLCMVLRIGQPALHAPWTTSTSPRKLSSSTCPSHTRPAPTTRSGSRNSASRTTGSALC